MTARRGTGAPPPNRAMQEIREMLAEQGGRQEARDEALNARMDRFERDLRQNSQKTDLLVNDFKEIRLQMGEVRDAAALGTGKVVEGAAKGGAAGVTEHVQPVVKSAVQEAVHELLRNRWVRTFLAVATVAGGFSTLMIAANNVPDAMRAWDKAWAIVRDFDQPDEPRARPAAGAPPK